MRVWKEAHIEKQVRIEWYAILITEADNTQLHLSVTFARRESLLQKVAQSMDSVI